MRSFGQVNGHDVQCRALGVYFRLFCLASLREFVQTYFFRQTITYKKELVVNMLIKQQLLIF